MKFIGKIGHGKVVHIMNKSIISGLPADMPSIFYYTSCGADHATNRGAPKKRILGEADMTKVTCRKCLKRTA